MVLTVDKLNLQVAELEKQYDNMLANLGNEIVNSIMRYQATMNQVKAKIDLIHNQIGELVKENNKAKKEAEKKKEEVKK